jgi:aromatic ring-opening dioxygenase catalytic subunit (LigB family)
MTGNKAAKMSPVLFIPHGGGPLPLLGDKNHESLVAFLQTISRRLGKPAAILLISAHWEEDIPTITSAPLPQLVYDYYGFPDEAYEVKYAAHGDVPLAHSIQQLVNASGIQIRLDDKRGFDHGMFVPLKIMYPDADIPCLQISLRSDLDPQWHIGLGKSLAALREQNILIIGSGLSFHNMQAFFSPTEKSQQACIDFNNWLIKTCAEEGLSYEEREQNLLNWQSAPYASYCHPREEHLIPLHVCYGAALAKSSKADVVFNEEVLGHRVTGLLWD